MKLQASGQISFAGVFRQIPVQHQAQLTQALSNVADRDGNKVNVVITQKGNTLNIVPQASNPTHKPAANELSNEAWLDSVVQVALAYLGLFPGQDFEYQGPLDTEL